ncbi:MAG: lipopolysaccharide kinase InaA family protein [Candidatus Brocadiales bacterium]
MPNKPGFDKSNPYLKGLNLPGPFRIEEEGGSIFIFKEGYENIVRSAERRVPGSESRNPQSAIQNLRTAAWVVEPPGILTVSSQASKGAVQPIKKTVEGRAEHPCIPIEGEGTAILRRVRHGGLWGKLAGDILWGAGRPVQELINTNKALERGVPTAEILGVRLEGLMGPIFGLALPLYRAEVFSRELPEAVDLIEFLESLPPDRAKALSLHKRKIIRTVAMSVRAMHEAGLYHNDLHLKNILITREAPFKAYIIDLDRSSLHEFLPLAQRIKNLVRLDRSVEKFIAVVAYRNMPLRLITRRDKLRFLRDYEDGNPIWKEVARGLNPGHTFHRWWWRVLGIGCQRSVAGGPKTDN